MAQSVGNFLLRQLWPASLIIDQRSAVAVRHLVQVPAVLLHRREAAALHCDSRACFLKRFTLNRFDVVFVCFDAASRELVVVFPVGFDQGDVTVGPDNDRAG